MQELQRMNAQGQYVPPPQPQPVPFIQQVTQPVPQQVPPAVTQPVVDKNQLEMDFNPTNNKILDDIDACYRKLNKIEKLLEELIKKKDPEKT